jgi:arylsulfatase A-like enzyme
MLKNRPAAHIHYELTRQRALKLAVEPDLGLVLLHYPVPHLPAIGDRHTVAGNDNPYTDNLALTDATLKELRNTMEAAGQWDGCFVLLSSDHPLRSDALKTFSGTRAQRHPWIPFLLKAPGQKTAVAYSKSFNSVLSQELILVALRGEIRTAEDATAWLDHSRARYPGSSTTQTSADFQ